jgi:hypothetical protein
MNSVGSGQPNTNIEEKLVEKGSKQESKGIQVNRH